MTIDYKKSVTRFNLNKGIAYGQEFNVPFEVRNKYWLKVFLTYNDFSEKELTIDKTYSYDKNIIKYFGDDDPLAAAIVIKRQVPYTQEIAYNNYGGASGLSADLERSFDKITMIAEQLSEEKPISLSTAESSFETIPNTTIPIIRNNTLMAFDNNNNLQVVPKYTGGNNTEITDENIINVRIDTATPEEDGLMSKEDKAKLDVIEDGAQKNIQSDWINLNPSSDAYIKNKPILAKVATTGTYYDLVNAPVLKPVATSGSYNDLTNRPTAEEGIELTEETYPKLRLKHASAENLGGIKVGRNLTIEADGTMHAESGIQDLVAGDNIIIDNVGGIQDGIQGAFHSVIYGHGLYVAIGYGVIARSPDGRNWIKNNIVDWVPTLTDATLTSIISDDTRFVVSVRSPGCFIEISKDFSSHNMIPFSDDTRIDGIVSLKDNGMYGVYGDTASTGEGFVRCTADFRSWDGPVGMFTNWFRADHACYVEASSVERYVFFTGGTSNVVRGKVYGNYIDDFHVTEQVGEGYGFLTGVVNTPDGLCVTSDSGIIYISKDFGETWEFWSQVSMGMIDAFDYNDTEYYAAAGGSLFYSEDGKHWKDSYLGDQYVFSGLHVTNNLIVAAGAKAMGGDGRHLYYIPLGDLTISAIDTTYISATWWDDGLMSSSDKKKFDELAKVAISGSYNDLSNKLVGGENIRIDENNVVSYVGGGEDLYKAGEYIKIEKTHNVEKCYEGSNSTVNILLHNDEYVTAPIYPNKLMLSDVSRKCEEWQEVVLPFECSGHGVVRSNSHIYVVDKDNHVRKSNIGNLVTWIDDGRIPKEPSQSRHYKGSYGICGGKEHVIFYAVAKLEPAETAIAYYIDGMQRVLKVLPYRIVGMAFDGNRIYCATEFEDILIYTSEFESLIGTLSIKGVSLIDIKYSNNRLLVLAWGDDTNSSKCLYASAHPYISFEKVTDDFDKNSLNKIYVYKNTFSFVCDNKLRLSEDAFNWSFATLDKAYEFGIYLNKFSLVYKKSNNALFRYMGGMNTISAIYENATAEADGLMSKEDKLKLNAAMKFPDGEAGYTLPDAAGRADKLITFDSNGNIDLHSTHDYDKWRNVRISTTESTVGLNLELPNPTERANKVIGFNADGKSIEMKTAGGGAEITVGEGLQKNGNEISLMSAGDAHVNQLGGIYRSHRSENDLLMIEPDGQAYAQLPNASANTLGGIKVGSGLSINNDGVLSTTGGGESGEFINDPVITGDTVSERIAFVDRDKRDVMPSCVASFVINGKKTFFIAEGNHIYRSNDCISWHKTEKINNAYQIVSFLQSGENILFAARLDESPNSGGEIFLSSDGGYSFTKKPVSPQSFYGWHEIQGYILICSYHGLYNSLNGGDTWNIVPNSVNDIFSSPVFFKGKFYFFRKTRESDKYSTIVSMTTLDYTFVTEYTFIDNHIPLSLTVDDDNSIYVVVKDGTGYPQSFIYRSYDGSNFTLIQTYNNQYTKLLGKPNKWLLIDYNKQAWFIKDFTDNPTSVYSTSFGLATEYHYSKNTDLFMIHDMGLFVSTTAYHIGV